MNKTIEAFVEEIYSYPMLKIKIKENIQLKKKKEMVFNVVQLFFDFSNNEVEITYFIKDDKFPDTKIYMLEFSKLLK